jgi:tetratricopeptide (TPR) repeat protein
MKILKYFPYYVLIFLLFGNYEAKAQLLKDKSAMLEVQNGITSIYNYEFAKASQNINQIAKNYPGHPVIPLLQSFKMYWEFLPIQDHPAELQTYLNTLQVCLKAIDKYFGPDSQEPEAIFYTIAARGYIAMYYNYQNELLKAALEAKKAYNALTKGQSLIYQNPEFYFTSGLYNYYFEVYPEKKPIIKPAIWLFKKGNKALGIEQLMKASRVSVISKAEAQYYLAHILLEYENEPKKALEYTRKLNLAYPANPVYRMVYLETLLHNKQFEDADNLMKSKPLPNRSLYRTAIPLFQGYLAEYQDKNMSMAESLYKKSLSMPLNDQYTGEYHALAYAGLGRIAHLSGNPTLAKDYYKKCLRTAEYKLTVQEANNYLKSKSD